MARPCPHPTGEPKADTCPVCKLYATNEKFKAYCDTLVLTKNKSAPTIKTPAVIPSDMVWRWISTAELVTTTAQKLIPKLPYSISGVCGVTRSGMVPATVIATHMHLPLYAVSQHSGDPILLPSGSRGYGKGGGKILVVDDTVYSGSAFKTLRARLGSNYIYAAVYARKPVAHVCDFYGEYLESPHLLEWNLFNSIVLAGSAINPIMHGGVALDFDGIICGDPLVNEDINPTGYASWLANATPLLLPRRLPAKVIITARHERHRQATLDWCNRWGVKVDKLVMREGDVDVAKWKADVYKASKCSLYIESGPQLAEQIARLSNLPVACPAASKVFYYPRQLDFVAAKQHKKANCKKCGKHKKKS